MPRIFSEALTIRVNATVTGCRASISDALQDTIRHLDPVSVAQNVVSRLSVRTWYTPPRQLPSAERRRIRSATLRRVQNEGAALANATSDADTGSIAENAATLDAQAASGGVKGTNGGSAGDKPGHSVWGWSESGESGSSSGHAGLGQIALEEGWRETMAGHVSDAAFYALDFGDQHPDLMLLLMTGIIISCLLIAFASMVQATVVQASCTRLSSWLMGTPTC